MAEKQILRCAQDDKRCRSFAALRMTKRCRSFAALRMTKRCRSLASLGMTIHPSC
jgi:hypothetical protein